MAELDLLIKNGSLVDGTGKPAIRGDIGVKDDRIVLVGRANDVGAASIFDAKGKVVAPGFIDVHAHSDYLLLMEPQADSKVFQGITTDIGGNCGLSAGPFENLWFVDWWIDAKRNFSTVPWDEGASLVAEHGVDLNWRNIDGFFHQLEERGTSVNYASLVGHYVMRATAYGEPNVQPTRRATSAEIRTMKDMVRAAMEQGALGFSCGFHHTDPELDVETDEFIQLCKVVAEFDGLFAMHLRDYTERLLSSVKEAITIAEATGVRTSISHLYADGKEQWGKLRPALDMIAEARERGVPIYTDVLLTLQARNYMAGGLNTLLPDEAVEEAGDDWQRYFSSAANVESAVEKMRGPMSNRWYKARFYPPNYYPLWDEMIRVVHCGSTKEYEGLLLSDVARAMGESSYAAVCHLLAQNGGDAQSVLERSSEADIIDVLQNPLSMIGSDGNPLKPLKSPRTPNPRIYGTFPRLFGHYVRDLGALSLEQAVLKCTSLPAQFLGLKDRGELRENYKADIVVFDKDEIRDCPNLSGYPNKYSEGIHLVLVNGKATLRDGTPTNALPGKVLRR